VIWAANADRPIPLAFSVMVADQRHSSNLLRHHVRCRTPSAESANMMRTWLGHCQLRCSESWNSFKTRSSSH